MFGVATEIHRLVKASALLGGVPGEDAIQGSAGVRVYLSLLNGIAHATSSGGEHGLSRT